MIPFSVLILGSGSALPTVDSNQTSQLLSLANQSFLIDCGEGTQIELRRNKVKMQQIGHVFISHLHGDHYFGLVGLLSTMHLLGRNKSLNIYAPPGLKEIVQLQFRNGGSYLSFEMIFHEITRPGQLLYEDKRLNVYSLPLNHRIACYGFLFQEKPALRKIKVEALKEHQIPKHFRRSITEGKDFINAEGKSISNELITNDPPPVRSYAYCSDTAYHQALVDKLPSVDLLYHEATFLEKDRERAKLTFHSTAKDAAKVANLCGAKRLLIGHCSNRYKSKVSFVNEARQIFKESEIAEEGVRYDL